MLFSRKPTTTTTDQIITVPSNLLIDLFGKVNYRKIATEVEVQFTIMLPAIGEGWRTGVALDASESMRQSYGRALTGNITDKVINGYRKRGWVRDETRDGVSNPILKPEAYEDAMKAGYLHWTPNEVEPKAREFLQYLAQNLDSKGCTLSIYWAGGDGSQIEEIGEVKVADCSSLKVAGPQKMAFGKGTCLTPALTYFEQRFSDAVNAMFIFITDGKLDDLDAVKAETTKIARLIEADKRNPLKCVLIGLGADIDEQQMTELDDLDTGTDVDIWDHKIAKDMRELTEIFAELVDEAQIVAPMANIYDSAGNLVMKCTDGLPARLIFKMPASSTAFTLEIPGLPGQGKFVQSLLLPGKVTL